MVTSQPHYLHLHHTVVVTQLTYLTNKFVSTCLHKPYFQDSLVDLGRLPVEVENPLTSLNHTSLVGLPEKNRSRRLLHLRRRVERLDVRGSRHQNQRIRRAQEAAPGIKWAPGFNPESSSSRAPVKPAPNPDELVIMSSDDECKFSTLLPCRC